MSAPRPGSRPGRRRLLAAIVGVLVALLAFELVLQAAAFWLWRNAGRESAVGDRSRVLLCIGDSFTYGLGASGPGGAYPAQLGAILEERAPGEFAVVNGGWPGQTSAAVLQRLPRQLARHRPTHVVVLVGYNDRWKKPDPVADDAGEIGDEGFPIRWRTGELLARIASALAGDGVDERSLPIGAWVAPGVRLELAADRAVEMNGESGTWSVRDDRLVIVRGSGELVFEWERAGDALVLRAAGLPDGELRFLPAERADEIRGEGVPGRLLLERALADSESIDPEWVAEACAFLREHPQESPLWWRLSAAAGRNVGRDEILATVDHALTRVGTDDPWRAGLLRMRAALTDPSDPVGAFAAVLEAALLDDDDFSAIAWLDAQRGRLGPEQIEAAIEQLDPNDDERARIDAMLLRADAPPERTAEVLAGHLERIAARCRDAGALPMFVTYPEPTPQIDGAIRRAARTADVPLCDTVPAFAAVLSRDPAADLFAPDRHCNDAGYRLVAETVADALLR
jgi:lysophospholipase L1-like esterase